MASYDVASNIRQAWGAPPATPPNAFEPSLLELNGIL
jgi:hypothetical protein